MTKRVTRKTGRGRARAATGQRRAAVERHPSPAPAPAVSSPSPPVSAEAVPSLRAALASPAPADTNPLALDPLLTPAPRSRERTDLPSASRISTRSMRGAFQSGDTPLSGGTVMLDRAQFAQLAGLTFETPTGAFRRDPNDALGYVKVITLADYWRRYKRGGIAARIVQAYPKATWAGEIWLREVEDARVKTKFEDACALLFTRLRIWQRLLRADILAGIGEYSTLLIGAPGVLESPLPRVASPDQIAYLQPLSQLRAKIASYVDSPTDPRFGLPAVYEVTLGANKPSVKVHWSRMIHLADDLLENEVFGTPRLEAVWNHLDDLLKVVGGGSEAAWSRMDPGMQVDVDPEIEFGTDEEDDLDEQIDSYRHGLDRTLRTRGTKINMLAANVAAFGPNATAILEQISGTSGVPLRILLGTERGQLASTQDRDNWADRVAERRRMYGVEVLSTIVDRFIECGALPKPAAYSVVWSEIEELNSQAKAAVAMSLAQANAATFQVEMKPLLTVDEIRADVFNKEPLEWEPPEVEDGSDPDNPELETEIGDEGSDASDDDDEAMPARAAFAAVTTAPSDPDWRAVHHVADAYLVAAERSWRKLWRDAATIVSDRAYQLDHLLGQRNAQGAESIVLQALSESEDRHAQRVANHLSLISQDAGHAAARVASRRGSLFDPTAVELPTSFESAAADDDPNAVPIQTTFNILFDATDAASIAFAKGYAYDLIVQTTPETRAAIRNIIVRGLSEGIEPRRLRDMITRVIGLRTDQVTALENFIARGASRRQAERYAKKLLRDRALLIARTEVQRAANEGQRILWMQAASSGLLPADQKRKWITTLDGRERDAHHDMHGQIRGLNEKFTNPDSGARIEPGQEPNCLLPGSLVSGSFVAGLKAAYAGPAYEIKTARGHRLSVTANHPVVTTRGCVAAWDLRKGDQLLGYSGAVQMEAVSNLDNDHAPRLVEEVFKTLALQGLRVQQMRGDHLHGDARWTNGNVEVVGSDRVLTSDESDPGVAQRVSEFTLSSADVQETLVARTRSGELDRVSVGLPTSSVPGAAALPLDRGAVLLHPAPLHQLCFGPAARLDTVLTERARQDPTINVEFVGQLLDRASGEVALDEIVDVRQFDFAGHVYDLQSEYGWMMAQGIVISNCRCASALATAAEVRRYEREQG